VHRADNLTTVQCRLSWNLGASNSWNPKGLSKPEMGLLYLLYYLALPYHHKWFPLAILSVLELHLRSTKNINCAFIWLENNQIWLKRLIRIRNFRQNIVNTNSCVIKKTEFIFCLYKDRSLELWWWKEYVYWEWDGFWLWVDQTILFSFNFNVFPFTTCTFLITCLARMSVAVIVYLPHIYIQSASRLN